MAERIFLRAGSEREYRAGKIELYQLEVCSVPNVLGRPV